jgi:nicotinamide-nucleotide amidase
VTDLEPLLPLAGEIVAACTRGGLMLATAESCTGGLVAAVLTEIAGSSAVVDRGFVTYSNDAKTAMLGVAPALIGAHGAVSREVAIAMAEGAIRASRADIAVAVTGIAGPAGGTADKPVGLVHFAVAVRGGATTHAERRFGNIGRTQVRLASVRAALEMIDAIVSPIPPAAT